LDPKFSDALDGLENNSHVVVIFWLDRVDEERRKILKLHPKGREDLPLVGVFATRSPARPNPIGIRAVKILNREGNTLDVLGLDALNGTPVLDLKPYSLKHDFVENAKVPNWVKRF
jgi:tRNA-Thr(GGU) m(6)t(6)A37 methyltransferase TsaA